jgi:hypothetical protein
MTTTLHDVTKRARPKASADQRAVREKISCGQMLGSAIMTLMGAAKMHADEIETNVALMRKPLAGQFPQWMDLPISRVMSYGTDNYIYRLGDRLAARLPRHPGWGVDQVKLEARRPSSVGRVRSYARRRRLRSSTTGTNSWR